MLIVLILYRAVPNNVFFVNNMLLALFDKLKGKKPTTFD